MTRVKICGITRLEDAQLASTLGAWAVGFIFWPGSPRFIDPDEAAPIVSALSPLVVPVGVFVDQPVEVVNDVARRLRLGAVQLHGSESNEYMAHVEPRIIKAASLESCTSRWLDTLDPACLVLLDAADPVRRGGTGQTIDWESAARVAAARPTVLAGGITPANIASAVRRVRPAAVDVSSGVEHAPGIKDPDRLRALFQALEGVEAAS
jgi:phosphoribosylanthranilate isomerase